MKDKSLITIPIEVEHFLSFMFGKDSTHGLTGHHPEIVWKRYCTKLTVHLEKYINKNVITDKVHGRNIQLAIDDMKGGVNSIAREPLLVAALCRLCLLLLGEMPDHWEKKTINRPEHFMLDQFRSLQYCQSAEQKAKLIIATYVEPQLSREPRNEDADRLWNEYTRVYNRKGKHAEFVDYFRKTYPNEYLSLFG